MCSDSDCDCKSMDLEITTGSVHSAITRTISGLCELGFKTTSIVPGLGYEFKMIPTVKMTDTGSIIEAKSKSFTVFNEMDPMISSFRVVLKWKKEQWSSLKDFSSELSPQKLLDELSLLTKLDPEVITV